MNTKSLSDLWATRPVRRRKGHKVAGVCSGFGARYDIDPTLIRVAFVVATIFGGSGILLYVAAVIAMPSEPKGTMNTEVRRSRRKGKPWGLSPIVMIIIAAIVVASTFGSGGDAWSSGWLAGTALMLLGWWLLYQRTPDAPEGTAANQLPTDRPTSTVYGPQPPIPPEQRAEAAVPTPADAAGTAKAEAGAPDADAKADGLDGDPAAPRTAGLTETTVTSPPAWDPLGAAPFAWDLPDPTAVEPVKQEQPKNSLTPVVTGLAILTAVAGFAAGHLLGIEWFTTGRIASLALGVLGAGMLVAAFQKRAEGGHASGLVGWGILAAVIAVVATLSHQQGWSSPTSGGVGERKFTVTEQSELRDQKLGIGNIDLDLSGLDKLDKDTSIDLQQGVGEIKVKLPEKVRVRTECSVGVGDYDCPQGVVGDGDGPVLTINARTGLGNVEMKR